jgi:hypothetical protein
MAFGYAAPLMLEAAIEHKVFDVLDRGSMTAQEVATATETSPRGMRILLQTDWRKSLLANYPSRRWRRVWAG